MQLHPSPLFRPFADKLDIWLLSKQDNVFSDEDTAHALQDGRLAMVKQVHGNTTLIIREPGVHPLEADGMITDVPGLTLTIRAADCQLLLAFAPKTGAVGVVHAGWKGLLAGAIPKFIEAFSEAWGIEPHDLWVMAAPSLCMRCSEFTDPKRELPGINHAFFENRLADLRAIGDAQLWKAGVRPSQFERMPDCTKCDAHQYWSYRGPDREKVLQGARNVLACRVRKA
jgi:polyphenol oxidase